MNAIKRFLKRVEAALKGFFGDVMWQGNGGVVSAERVRLEAERVADGSSVRWGASDIEFPNRYVVLVDQGSWDAYYRSRTKVAADKVAGMVLEHVRDEGGSVDGRLAVSIAPDPGLPARSCRVEASYCEDTSYADHAARSDTDDPEGLFDQEIPAVNAPEDRTEIYHADSGADMETELNTSMWSAYVTAGYLDRPARVYSGCVMGVRRYADMKAPGIELPKEFPLVSHRHCSFSGGGDGGVWMLTAHSANGASVLRGGTEYLLDREVPFPVQDGDVIRLAGTKGTETAFHVNRHAGR